MSSPKFPALIAVIALGLTACPSPTCTDEICAEVGVCSPEGICVPFDDDAGQPNDAGPPPDDAGPGDAGPGAEIETLLLQGVDVIAAVTPFNAAAHLDLEVSWTVTPATATCSATFDGAAVTLTDNVSATLAAPIASGDLVVTCDDDSVTASVSPASIVVSAAAGEVGANADIVWDNAAVCVVEVADIPASNRTSPAARLVPAAGTTTVVVKDCVGVEDDASRPLQGAALLYGIEVQGAAVNPTTQDALVDVNATWTGIDAGGETVACDLEVGGETFSAGVPLANGDINAPLPRSGPLSFSCTLTTADGNFGVVIAPGIDLVVRAVVVSLDFGATVDWLVEPRGFVACTVEDLENEAADVVDDGDGSAALPAVSPPRSFVLWSCVANPLGAADMVNVNSAQTGVYVGDVTTQAEVLAIPSVGGNEPFIDVEVIVGNVDPVETIGARGNLDRIKTVTGSMTWSNDDLDANTVLNFPALRTVGGSFTVSDYAAGLTEINVPELTTVGANFSVTNNDTLTTVDVFPDATDCTNRGEASPCATVGNNFTFQGNNGLDSTEICSRANVVGTRFGCP